MATVPQLLYHYQDARIYKRCVQLILDAEDHFGDEKEDQTIGRLMVEWRFEMMEMMDEVRTMELKHKNSLDHIKSMNNWTDHLILSASQDTCIIERKFVSGLSS
ncbi:unnamed protein product [Spodoptera exigua]|nr:unnamed protein product [Spodoptera exigua]